MPCAPFAKYKDAFGRPGEGSHAFQIAGIAVVDTLLTVIGAYLISRATHWPFLAVLVILVILAVLVHGLFGVTTRLNSVLLGRPYRAAPAQAPTPPRSPE